MRDKKGFLWLGEETAKILLGIVVVVGLLAFLFVLFWTFLKVNKLEQAKSAINEIREFSLRLGNGEYKEIIYESPREWTLRFYKSVQEGMKGCNSNCLYLCEKEDCSTNKKYICSEFSGEVIVEGLNRKSYILFERTPVNLRVSKNGGKYTVSLK